MSVILDFYVIEEATGIKVKIDDSYSFGNLFKGTQRKVPLAIYNRGTSPAINPIASIQEYKLDGTTYGESYKWKNVSLSKNAGYGQSVQLPNIQGKSWMTGKDIYYEDFSKYSTEAGTKPDQEWLLWGGSEGTWEIYSGYLQHNVDTQLGRALWNAFPYGKDYEFSCKITVRDTIWAGIIMRDVGDFDTGYMVIVQGNKKYLPSSLPSGHGVIQVYRGKFTSGIDSWVKLYESGTIGVRGTHDTFKVKLKGNRFDFWYNDSGEKPKFTFIDEDFTYDKAAKPILCTDAGNGGTLIYFDDIKMEVENENGILWIDNTVNPRTGVTGSQYTILKVDFGGW